MIEVFDEAAKGAPLREMTDLPSNQVRGCMGFFSIGCMILGAGLLWGIGGALFVGGLYMALDLSSDELAERFTKTTRGKR